MHCECALYIGIHFNIDTNLSGIRGILVVVFLPMDLSPKTIFIPN